MTQAQLKPHACHIFLPIHHIKWYDWSMVKHSWNDFQSDHPEPAELLLQEYHGFEQSPWDLDFTFPGDGSIVATDRTGAFADPWVWDPVVRAWLS